MLYGVRSNGKEHGSVMTKPDVVSFILDAVGYTHSKNLSELKIIEPAAGDGAFVLEAIRRLVLSSKNHHFDAESAIKKNMVAVEINSDKASMLQEKISSLLSELSIKHHQALAASIVLQGDFLAVNLPKFDIVIGNPPYIRYEQIPIIMKENCRSLFRTFRGRSDIYLAFFEKSLNLLSMKGKMCFICSDRWMKNSYGKELRKFVASSFSVPLIVNLNSAQAFEEKVSGYPSIISIQREPSKTLYLAVLDVSQLKYPLANAEQIRLDKTGEPWGFNYSEHIHVKKMLSSLESQGFNIGIGVATGSDEIFVGNHLPKIIEREVLLPLVVSKDLIGGVIQWSGNYVINIFDEHGKLLEIKNYPKLREYLDSHKEKLSKRHISKRKAANWYRTIDVVHKHLSFEPKILLPDIKKRQRLVIDIGQYYPHHNIYFVWGRPLEELRLLAAILMSDFVLHQLEGVSTIMRGGYVRWQTQNLRRIKIPIIDKMPPKLRKSLSDAYSDSGFHVINRLLESYLQESDMHVLNQNNAAMMVENMRV